MLPRKICVVSSTRADYGLLFWLMKEIQNDPDLNLQIIVTGMHLSPEFGLTYKLFEKDGFIIDEKVEMLLSSDTPVGIGKSIGLATIGFADAFYRLQPDILVLLGDRYEILAAAQAAMVARIPIAHIHGGEVTEGAIDEAIRHSITKMSHLHFVAAEPYRKRVIQLGENPKTVYNFGAPGLDNIKKLQLFGKEEFEEFINFKLGSLNFLVTYHPVTLNGTESKKMIQELLDALDLFPNAKIIFTKPNSDTDGRVIGQLIDCYAVKHPKRAISVSSLGHIGYLSAVKHVDVVIGNSSSGLIEVPVFKKATVNLGDRQKGRLKAASIIDCDENKESIVDAINKAISDEFQSSLYNVKSLYGEGNGDISKKIKEILKKTNLDGLIKKKFFDVEYDI